MSVVPFSCTFFHFFEFFSNHHNLPLFDPRVLLKLSLKSEYFLSPIPISTEKYLVVFNQPSQDLDHIFCFILYSKIAFWKLIASIMYTVCFNYIDLEIQIRVLDAFFTELLSLASGTKPV